MIVGKLLDGRCRYGVFPPAAADSLEEEEEEEWETNRMQMRRFGTGIRDEEVTSGFFLAGNL